eukprot:CAMPEP_0197519626 /NCGR_PEP_ID=MMETSP1318-20131121/4900_1 /TAXON_ID=552666 /ORGANISM="Partenskyella glossopodia, Strain RCC365" /LENGTH=227 /DNA_ID=CAMNT_0043070719 /DNA_START=26 /DNA_END=709 /DNA_ORIENTATION=-
MTLVYQPKPATPWLIWVKTVPQTGMQAMRDLLTLMKHGPLMESLPGIYLNRNDCPTSSVHDTITLLGAPDRTTGATLSIPAHIGYNDEPIFLTIQPPLDSCAAYSISLFESRTRSLTDGFKVGHKLEAVDFLGHHCVATVQEVDTTFQRIFVHFDGWDGDWDFWTSPDSAFVAPIGTTESLDLPLDPPRGYLKGAKENFVWNEYLEESMSEAVSESSFKQEVYFQMQ